MWKSLKRRPILKFVNQILRPKPKFITQIAEYGDICGTP